MDLENKHLVLGLLVQVVPPVLGVVHHVESFTGKGLTVVVRGDKIFGAYAAVIAQCQGAVLDGVLERSPDAKDMAQSIDPGVNSGIRREKEWMHT